MARSLALIYLMTSQYVVFIDFLPCFPAAERFAWMRVLAGMESGLTFGPVPLWVSSGQFSV
jgi:hypothetical protein